nr:hypothetical protein [Tanacetum cinerariifolium]
YSHDESVLNTLRFVGKDGREIFEEGGATESLKATKASKIDIGDQDEGQARPNPGDHDEGQAGLNPGKLEQHMVNLLQYNLALEERLDKHGFRLYKLENLNIPHQVSKAVDEIVTDVVDWAMQAPLQARFSDLPAVDMKEILQQRMFEDKSYEAHEDHKKLYDALEKSLERDYLDQLLSGLEKARQKKRKRRNVQELLLGLHHHSHHLHLLQQVHLVLQVYFSNDKDSGNDHLLTIDSRKDWWKPLHAKERPATPKPAWTISSSTISDAYEVVKAFYPDVIHLQFQMEECHKMLTDQVDWTNPKGYQVKMDVNRPLPLGGSPDMLLCHVKKKSDQPCGFLVSSELKPTPHMGMTTRAKLSFEELISKNTRLLKKISRTLVFPVNNNERKIMQFNEIYKFSDGTLTQILKALAYRVKEFKIKRLNPDEKDLSESGMLCWWTRS